jgi:zinc-ribbon domain
MKIFNGRAATEEYMSTHSLTFSTPEMTLKKFALWLGEQVSQPDTKENVPRLILYLEDKEKVGKKDSDFLPDIDDTFKPSGAVTEMYGGKPSSVDRDRTPPDITQLNKPQESRDKFCIECGLKLKINSRFCTKCGTKQE